MIVHVMPTYQCNMDCCYCYLGRKKKDAAKLLIGTLRKCLEELAERYTIDTVNIYGGEVTLLGAEYLSELIEELLPYTEDISMTTNLRTEAAWQISENLMDAYPCLKVATSINDEREGCLDLIMRLMRQKEKRYGLTQVVTPALMKKPSAGILKVLQAMGGSVEFLRYSPAENRVSWNIGNKDFENFMLGILKEYDSGGYSIHVHNFDDIDACIRKAYNPYADSNIFIDPYGRFCTVWFDANGKESFKEIKLDEIPNIVRNEKALQAKKCGDCRYLGSCYAEHIKKWQEDDECCGCKKLLEYYEESLYQDD